MKKNQKGFSVVEVLIVVVIAGLLCGIGWLVWDRNKSDKKAQTEQSAVVSTPAAAKEDTTKTYTIPNEALTFTYDSKTSTVTAGETNDENDLYIERVKVKTGSATLSVTTGIDGIGGGPQCTPDEAGKGCEVLKTQKSSFLAKPITYRLVKGDVLTDCGSAGKPDCANAPLKTIYFLDTATSTDEYGPCCGMINATAKNTGKKAKVTGGLLVSIETEDAIENKDMLDNADIQATIKIIESMHY